METLFNQNFENPECICNFCKKSFSISKSLLSCILKKTRNRYFCSSECSSLSKRKRIKINCHFCNASIIKFPFEIKTTNYNFCNKSCKMKWYNKNRKSKKIYVPCNNCSNLLSRTPWYLKSNKHHFCNKTCAAIYRNKNKSYGYKRSKLEIWLEEKLNYLYPNLKFEYNNKNILEGLELDIFIPSLKIAFELNGIFHYEPIYGENVLEEIVNRDERKFQNCIKNGISLCVIDTSSQKRFTEKTSIKYLNIIKSIINQKIHSLC